MRAFVLLALCACAGDDRTGCPATAAELGTDCRTAVEVHDGCVFPATGAELELGCECTETGFWLCNSCPFFWVPAAPALPACTPGTGCVINSWEHGCDCGCTSAGEWSCFPLTINSSCPM
jgi:hypothetical protein